MQEPVRSGAVREFEIHFAAEEGRFPQELKQELRDLGFKDDGLIGRGVAFPESQAARVASCPLVGIHVTWEGHRRDEAVLTRRRFESLLDRHEHDTVGYAHGEVVREGWDVDLGFQPFQSAAQLPAGRFKVGREPAGKRWDIHISAFVDSLDPGLQSRLFEGLGMYYIDIRKQSGRVARVFTVQGVSSPRSGLRLFGLLRDYLRLAGGMEGAVKFEQTTYWRVLGGAEIVPPVVRRVEF